VSRNAKHIFVHPASERHKQCDLPSGPVARSPITARHIMPPLEGLHLSLPRTSHKHIGRLTIAARSPSWPRAGCPEGAGGKWDGHVGPGPGIAGNLGVCAHAGVLLLQNIIQARNRAFVSDGLTGGRLAATGLATAGVRVSGVGSVAKCQGDIGCQEGVRVSAVVSSGHGCQRACQARPEPGAGAGRLGAPGGAASPRIHTFTDWVTASSYRTKY
jgi:hypothetical protein